MKESIGSNETMETNENNDPGEIEPISITDILHEENNN